MKVLHIKNMVCPRCITAVEGALAELEAEVLSVELGHAEVNLPTGLKLETIDRKLTKLGFELINDNEAVFVEAIKVAVQFYLRKVQNKGRSPEKLSDYLSAEIGKNYNSLSRTFSNYEGETIEKYFIHLRVEKVKELLDYGELNASEIAVELGYSSVQYLSNQFKQVTGVSVTEYKNNDDVDKRSFLSDL